MVGAVAAQALQHHGALQPAEPQALDAGGVRARRHALAMGAGHALAMGAGHALAMGAGHGAESLGNPRRRARGASPAACSASYGSWPN